MQEMMSTSDAMQPSTRPVTTGVAAAMVLATHPTTSAHLLNVRRLLGCIPAKRVVVSTSTSLVARTRKAVAAWVEVVSSDNDRYDTGKWCTGLRALGHALRHYRWVVLANDSIFLLHAVPQLFVALATGQYAMAGPVVVTSGWDTRVHESHHVQSFLRVFTRRALQQWQNRSCGLAPSHFSFRSKRAIVEYHEIGSSRVYGRKRVFGLYDGDSRAAGTVDDRGKPWHLNLSFWKDAWPRGFPVAKRPQLAAVCPQHAAELNTPLRRDDDDGVTAGGGLAACLEARFGRCRIGGPSPRQVVEQV